MSGKNDLTQGSEGKNLVLFALPYLLSSFMQTFYGMADLFVVGLYNGSETTTAVSVGSQVMHMLTVIIIGFVMGTTVWIGQCVGAKDEKTAAKTAGTSALFFFCVRGGGDRSAPVVYGADRESDADAAGGGGGDQALSADLFCRDTAHHSL